MTGIERRIASLRAFIEARDRQLSLPFSECGDDDRQEGGRFGPGNNCAGEGSDTTSTSTSTSTSTGSTSRAGFPSSWSRQDRVSTTRRLPNGIARLEVSNAKTAKAVAESMGVKGVDDLLRVGAATAKGSEVTIDARETVRWTSDGDKRARSVTIASRSPVEGGGTATVEVSLRDFEGIPPYIYYDYFQVDDTTKRAIADEKSQSGGGLSPMERRVSAALIDQMLESLAAADDAGIKIAKTSAAGSPGDSYFKGYRLWGRFGFDGDLDGTIASRLLDPDYGPSPLTSDQASGLRQGKKMSLQELLSTKAGERWWSQHGDGMNMELDFSNKDSIGYKRFRDFLDKHRRAKKRGEGRDYLDFVDFVCRSSVSRDLEEWPGFSDVERRNCGTGSGGFQKGNTCGGQAVQDVAVGAAKGAVVGAAAAVGKTGGFPPAVAAGAGAGAAIGAVKGLYDNRMRPTRAGKAIKEIGSSDEKVASLVKGLGGSPKSVAEADGKSAVTLSIKNKDGKSQFDVRMSKDEVRIKPASGRQNLTTGDIKQIKKIAEENSPKSVKVVVDAVPTSVLAKIVKAGGSLAVDAAGALVAAFVIPSAPAIAGTVIEGATGIEIEKTKSAQWVGEKILGNLPKRRG